MWLVGLCSSDPSDLSPSSHCPTATLPGIPYLSEYEEGRWRGQGEESSQLQADTNYHVGFLQVVMAIARSVSSQLLVC